MEVFNHDFPIVGSLYCQIPMKENGFKSIIEGEGTLYMIVGKSCRYTSIDLIHIIN